jgi:hypothetical protein
MRKRSVIILSILGIIAVLVVGVKQYLQWKFPYGRSHCCIKNVMFALEGYADEHRGIADSAPPLR